MQRKQYIWTIVILLVVGVVAWRVYGNYGKSAANTRPQGGKATAVVEVKKTTVGPIAVSINATGTVQGVREATIAGKTAGRIQSLNVSDGMYVAAGQTLVELDAAEIQAQINQALAVRNQALANRDNAQTNLKRLTNLYQEDAVAKQQLDNTQAQYQVYDAQVNQAGATISFYQAQLANTLLTAPFAGYIFNKRVVQGDMASPNMPLMMLVDMSRVKVETTVGENDIGKIKVGQAAQIAVDAYPGRKFSGTVSEISPAADIKNRTFKVWILCDNTKQQLRSGMFARVIIPYKENPQAVKIPKDALVIRDQQPCVFVIEDGVARLTPVVPGLESDTELEVSSGLASGTPVSIWGHEQLNDGDKVAVGKRGGGK